MKRAKFMLAAIAVLAIAGGVYASKAKSSDFVWVPTTTLPTTLCPVQAFGITYTTTTLNTYSILGTTDPTKPCVALRVKTAL